MPRSNVQLLESDAAVAMVTMPDSFNASSDQKSTIRHTWSWFWTAAAVQEVSSCVAWCSLSKDALTQLNSRLVTSLRVWRTGQFSKLQPQPKRHAKQALALFHQHFQQFICRSLSTWKKLS